jgi:hypothetical protein
MRDIKNKIIIDGNSIKSWEDISKVYKTINLWHTSPTLEYEILYSKPYEPIPVDPHGRYGDTWPFGGWNLQDALPPMKPLPNVHLMEEVSPSEILITELENGLKARNLACRIHRLTKKLSANSIRHYLDNNTPILYIVNPAGNRAIVRSLLASLKVPLLLLPETTSMTKKALKLGIADQLNPESENAIRNAECFIKLCKNGCQLMHVHVCPVRYAYFADPIPNELSGAGLNQFHEGLRERLYGRANLFDKTVTERINSYEFHLLHGRVATELQTFSINHGIDIWFLGHHKTIHMEDFSLGAMNYENMLKLGFDHGVGISV